MITLLCITIMAWVFQRMAWQVFNNEWAAWCAPVLVLLVFYGFTVGGNHIIYNSLISSTLAKAIASIALLQMLYCRWLIVGLLLGLASLFQVLVGFQLMLILTVAIPLLVVDGRAFAVIRAWTGYLPIALFVIVPTFRQQFGASIEVDSAIYYEVLYRFRNYHHYLPSLFPWTHYLKFIGLVFLGLLSYRFTQPSDRKFFGVLTGVALIGMVVYTIGLEVLGLNFIGKLQWFKTTVWISAISAVSVAGGLGMLLQSILPSAIVRNALPWVSAGVSVLLLVLITNSIWLPVDYNGRFMVGNRDLTDLEKMHGWISAHTPKDALFLVPPDNTSFSCQAKRPMPVHFHAIIHTPEFMLPWYEKIRTVYGVGLEDIHEMNARDLASHLYTMRNYRGSEFKINYRLDNDTSCVFITELGPIVHREGNWILTEFLSD